MLVWELPRSRPRELGSEMVGVAQLVELRIVIPAVVGSIPIVHPSWFGGWSGSQCAKVAELVDALDLGSSIERCESSSLSFRTSLVIRVC